MHACFEIPFQAIRNLLNYGVSCHAAAMTDSRIMSTNERRNLLNKLREIDQRIAVNLEEEIVDPYETTVVRMNKAGYDVSKFFSTRSVR